MGNTLGLFNSREIATGFWALVLLAWAVSQPTIRESLVGVLRAAVQPMILWVVVVAGLYTWGAVVLLAALRVWTPDLLNDTVFWFLGTGVVLVGRFITSRDTGACSDN